MRVQPSRSWRATIARGHLPALAAAAVIGSLIWFTTGDLAAPARWAVVIFALAMIAWTMTPLDDTAIALAAALALVATGAAASRELYGALGSELVWLMIATFMISEVLRQSELAQRVATRALRPVRTVRGMFYALTVLIFATAFVIPSPSARAAMLLPIYLALTRLLDDADIAKGLALLFATVILLSAGGVLTGSGAHLLALDLLGEAHPGQRLDYLSWLLFALPIAVIACFTATEIILRMFVSRAADKPLCLHLPDAAPLDARQWRIAIIVLTTVALWMTTSLHGIGLAVVALAAALLLTQPALSGVDLKSAVRGVEWPLVLFFAATVLLGQTMVTTGAGKWLADSAFAALPPAIGQSEVAIAVCVSVVALLSHLVMVSRTARAAVLVPTFALPLASFGYSPTALVLLTVIGTGFCQTLPVSAKTVTLFSRAGHGDAATTSDLVRLSAALFPVMLAAMLLSALFIWPHLGLSFRARE